ncbi:hypothetical protein WJX81_000786 [Elliptochloris bilobata]|uniref:Uncharacterized protein n=1 Tax=Elliptochloris bilobata TaxID=381761 RepID=A0AAW1RQB5_9CHLO
MAEQRAAFLASLERHWARERSPGYHGGHWAPPKVSSRNIDLAALYREVGRRGGADAVTAHTGWKAIARALGLEESAKAAATLRSTFEAFLGGYAGLHYDAAHWRQGAAALEAAERDEKRAAVAARKAAAKAATPSASPAASGGAGSGFTIGAVPTGAKRKPTIGPGAARNAQAERQAAAAVAAAAAREVEAQRQAEKLLERVAPLPGPCLVILGGFERARLHDINLALRSGLAGVVPWALNIAGLASFQARPELLLDELPGLLPALLRVIEVGLGDGNLHAAEAASAAADEAEAQEERECAARAVGWPCKAGCKRAREPPGAPKGWWWEAPEEGLLSDGGAGDERFTWALAAASALRNLAVTPANQPHVASAASVTVLVRCLDLRDTLRSPGCNELAEDALELLAPSSERGGVPPLLRALDVLLEPERAPLRLAAAAMRALVAVAQAPAAGGAVAVWTGARQVQALGWLLATPLEAAAAAAAADAAGECGPCEVALEDAAPAALLRAGVALQGEVVAAAAEALAALPGVAHTLGTQPRVLGTLAEFLAGARPPPWEAQPRPLDKLTAHIDTTLARARIAAGRALFCAAPRLDLGSVSTQLVEEAHQATGKGKGRPQCQVEGCSGDLTTLKEYHQRYKICEYHLKVNSILCEGKRQRFCQQCGRFHDLASFDGDKRSCRARLQRHNARRRKKGDTAECSRTSVGLPRLRGGHSLAVKKGPREDETVDYVRPASNRQKHVHAACAKGENMSLEDRARSSSVSSGRMSVDMSAGCEDDNVPPAPANFQPGLNAYGGMEPLTSMSELEALSADKGFMGLGAMPPAMPDYSDREYAAHCMQGMYSPAPHLTVAQAAGGPPEGPPRGGAGDNGGTKAVLDAGASVLDEVRALLSYNAGPPPMEYAAEENFTRMSAKLFNCTPAQLPSDLKANLVTMLQCGVNALEGYIRPGCVHLMLHALLGEQMGSQLQKCGVRAAVKALVAGTGAEFWRQETLLIQLHDEVALVRNGQVLHVLSGSGSRGVFPAIDAVAPRAVLASAPGPITLSGANLAVPDNAVLARCQGQYVPVKVEPTASPAAPTNLRQQVTVRLPAGYRPGAVMLEVVRGGFVSDPRPVLMLESAAAVADMERLDVARPAGVNLDAVALGLGRVLELKNAVAAALVCSQEPVRRYGAPDLAAVAGTARRLLLLCLDHGCAGIAAMVLPAVGLGCANVKQAVQCIEAAATRRGDGTQMLLLHLAVRSRSPALVELLVTWASAGRYEMLATTPGPNGVTPIHLAALLPDDGAMAAMLVSLCEDGHEAWTSTRCGAQSAAALAAAASCTAAEERVRAQLALMAESAEDVCLDEDDENAGEETEKKSASSAEDRLAEGAHPEAGVQAPPAHTCACEPRGLEDAAEVADKAHPRGPPADLDSAFNPDAAAVAVAKAQARLAADNPKEGSPPEGQALAQPSHSHDAPATPSCGSQGKGEHMDMASIPGSSGALPEPVDLGLHKRVRGGSKVAENKEELSELLLAGKGKGAVCSVCSVCSGDYYGNCDFYCVKVAPTVFDCTSAAWSAVTISAIGGATLFLRYYIDYFVD